ncbi:radical SAM/SPASM domain-containing protein [Elusimicrobiota bacterium]
MNKIDFDSDKRFKKDFIGLTEKIRSTGEVSLDDADWDYLPTLRCNLKCDLCYQKHTREQNKDSIRNEMSLEQFKEVFDKLEVEGKMVKFIGGEPFVKEELFDMMAYFKQRNAYNIVGTNSLALNYDKIRKLRDMNIVEVTSSIDGLEDTHNRIRGNSQLFKKVRDFVCEISKTHKVLLETVIQKDNLSELAELINLKKEWNIYKYRFQLPMYATSEKLKEARILLDDPEIETELAFIDRWEYDFSYEALMEAYENMKSRGIEFLTHPSFFEQDTRHCYEKSIRAHYNVFCTYLFRIRIEPDGMIRLCPFLIKFFGDIKKQSLEEIWNSEKFRIFRKKLLSGNLTPLCESCAHMRIQSKNSN